MSNLHVLNGNAKNDDLKKVLRQLRESLPTHMAIQEELARLTKNKYEVLLKQGFTEQQALELCKGGPF